MLQFRLAVVLLVVGFLNVKQVVEGIPQFKRCYNTSEEETHCFDVQYDTATNQPLFTSIQNAIRRCQAINSTLVISKNEEIDSLLRQFVEANNSIGYFWLNAYQINDYDDPYRWHWLNSTFPNLPEYAVSFTMDPGWYTAVLEFRTDTGGSQFYITAKQPSNSFSYVCEYSLSNCVSTSSNDVRLMNGRCYTAVQESVSWYNARNRCLKNGGDLASFPNVTSINFTSWLGSDPNVRFWIGLRFIWYTWGDQGQEVKYTNWNFYGPVWNASCVVFCYNCGPLFSWASRNCTDYMFVVCHTITPLSATTTPIFKIPTSTATTMLTTDLQQIKPSSSKESYGSLGIGLGVGLGVGLPLVIIIILTVVILAVRNKRLKKRSEQKTRTDRTELGTVQATSVGQGNDSTNDNNYQELNRNSSGSMMYDKLSVSSEAQYEEVIPNNY